MLTLNKSSSVTKESLNIIKATRRMLKALYVLSLNFVAIHTLTSQTADRHQPKAYQ